MKLRKMSFFSILIVPLSNPSSFLDLQYSKLVPNKVTLDKEISIQVKKTASPLFYKFDKVAMHKIIEVAGQVKIESPLTSEEKDSYFQLGIVYEGDYKPGSFVKNFLPEWLLKILSINEKYGVSDIDFHHVTNTNDKLDRSDSIRDITMNFKTAAKLDKDGKFKFRVNLKKKKVLGLWLRADGDDHQGKFKTTISKLKVD